jgi:hypothetical protein
MNESPLDHQEVTYLHLDCQEEKEEIDARPSCGIIDQAELNRDIEQRDQTQPQIPFDRLRAGFRLRSG